MRILPKDHKERAKYLSARNLIEWPPGSGTIYTAEIWATIPKEVIQRGAVADFIRMVGGEVSK